MSDDLVGRLRSRTIIREDKWGTIESVRNPDGEEAAARITALEARVAELEGALTGLVAFAEQAETRMLVGDEGCIWAVEAARAALTDGGSDGR